MSGHWVADAADYRRDWAGRRWHLRVDGRGPGLVEDGGHLGPLLSLGGISDRQRANPTPLNGGCLVGHESLFDRVESLYAPEGWGTLRVRATWSPRGEDGMDLEIQVQAFTVGDLEEVEVHVTSRLDPSRVEELPGLGPDRLARLREAGVTLPIRSDAAFPPLLTTLESSDRGPSYYLEMIHPDDGTRRNVDGDRGAIRYALLGHDLERGVIVRGRLRGVWLAERPDAEEVARHLEAFLREPPPLGT